MRTLFSALALVATIASDSAGAQVPNSEDTVKQLYKDYAWEAVMITADVWIGAESRSVLERYFDSDLAVIWVKSRECEPDFCGDDWIKYDPLWDSQDPAGFSDVSIQATNDPHIVRVEMSAPCGVGNRCVSGDYVKVRLTYYLQQTKQGWRISDIQSEVHGSLRSALLKETHGR
jgi:hypothetical protein